MCIYIISHILFAIMAYSKILTIVLCYRQWHLVVYLFYILVHICQSRTLIYSSSYFSPLVTIS